MSTEPTTTIGPTADGRIQVRHIQHAPTAAERYAVLRAAADAMPHEYTANGVVRRLVTTGETVIRAELLAEATGGER